MGSSSSTLKRTNGIRKKEKKKNDDDTDSSSDDDSVIVVHVCFSYNITKVGKKYLDFVFFKKTMFFLLFFKVFPTYAYTIYHFRGSFCIPPPVNHEEVLLLRYRFIAEIKGALIFVLSEPISQFLKQIKVAGVKVWVVRRVGQQLPLEEVDKFYCR